MAITLTDEAKSACRRKPIRDSRLFAILNSNDVDDEPTSEEARWLAARELRSRGYVFENLPKKDTVCTHDGWVWAPTKETVSA